MPINSQIKQNLKSCMVYPYQKVIKIYQKYELSKCYIKLNLKTF